MRAEDILPDEASFVDRDGMMLRKGTVAACLATARTWLDAQATPEQVAAAAAAMLAARPALVALGQFDLLRPRDPRLAALLTG